jgi:RNA polymerase sigma factor (sigma-70 family)
MEAVIRNNLTLQSAFTSLLSEHKGIVLKIAHAYARSADDRADLAQEISAQLWRAFPNYDSSRTFSTWMYRVALNVAISHLREHSQRSAHISIDDQAIESLPVDQHGNEQQALLQKLLAACDPMQRALLILYLEDRSTREIAEVLGISESNVTTKLNRLKTRLREQFAS